MKRDKLWFLCAYCSYFNSSAFTVLRFVCVPTCGCLLCARVCVCGSGSERTREEQPDGGEEEALGWAGENEAVCM